MTTDRLGDDLLAVLDAVGGTDLACWPATRWAG